MPFLFSLVLLAATVFAVVDIVTKDQSQIKHMPKFAWLILVILLPLVGVALWFAIGREYPERTGRAPRMAPRPAPAPAPPRDTRTTEQQLADLEREIEEENLRAELRRRRAEGE